MAKTMLALVLLGAEAFGASLPVENIFKARAETPIIEQAITDFQDICLTFMLHESEVSKSEDLKHFDSIIEASGYKKRSLTDNEHTAFIMGVYGRSIITPYTKENNSFDLRLKWRQPNKHSRTGRYSETEKEAIRKMPYGKYNGLSCGLRVALPEGTKFSTIETEILDYDADWQSLPKLNNSGIFAVFNEGRPIQQNRFQYIDFEQSSFVFRLIFDNPADVPKTLKSGKLNPYYDEIATPTLNLTMSVPLEEMRQKTKW